MGKRTRRGVQESLHPFLYRSIMKGYTGLQLEIDKNVYLKKGDTVYVFSESAGKDNKIYVFGDVARAGEFEYEEKVYYLELVNNSLFEIRQE